ncbi:outer membrane lipoprotein [Janthinobacterium sp. KBS0711]|uniref:BON domain-containing protein n=1 Tax=unclassified Janthinobacterium TaxID=2610881 RepID=UPI00062781E2|nr:MULTISPECIES: BON domain-containing protein [unclassified Janthinobacterium]KKO65798.1 outer membrane lipoprotein [Janthinobacterium sp. KBS0711]TSD69708.1 BON domain-containing protein [Janthinobacterium sp. KBS0711]
MTKFGTGPGWKRVQRPLATALLCGAMLTSLTGCIELMVGGAVMGGVAAADRRTLGAQTEDKSIALKGESRIPSIVGDVGHVNVTSFNRRVLLTGEVRDEAMKNAVEREVRNIEGVESVANELIIAGPASYTSRSNDALITTKVKASLVDMKTISAASFKVVTENATVFLMGRVTQREGTVAADVARGVGGVQKVVKLFDYISEAELKQLQPEPAPARTTSTGDTAQQ